MSGDITGTHPYADKFPMLSDPELDELAESIATVGLLHPIVIDRNGLILDGRNRLEACNRAEVEALTDVYEGDDVAEYVIACNVTRRNMSTGARAMSTALVLEAAGKRSNGRVDYGELKQQLSESGQSRQRMAEAFVVIDFKPDLAAEVISGAVTLNDAFTQADAIRNSAERDKIMAREKKKREKAEAEAEAQRNAEIVADLTQADSHYLTYVESGDMTPQAAWAAHREDTRKERERIAQERQVLSDRYTSMANACLTANSWGAYEDFQALMADYDPVLLNPSQLDRYLSLESLETVRRFADELIAWRKSL